jgi:glycosyltransferase involved in cell wall biosynthesis
LTFIREAATVGVRMRPVVLTFSEWFLPAFKSGGTARTLGNMTARLGRDVTFRIITRDRDIGDTAPFDDRSGSWTQLGQAEVMYLSPRQLSVRRIRWLLVETSHDVIYLNSCFSRYFSMLPLCIRRLQRRGSRKPMVLAPRGEFSPGAMSIRNGRKQAWLRMARALSLFEDVIWQASSVHEQEDIQRIIGPSADIRIAPDLTPPAGSSNASQGAVVSKVPGTLRVAHLGRISAIKNLLGALELLRHVHGNVDFHVMGPASSESYLAECRAQAGTLPPNIRVHFEGTIPPDQVPARLARCHVLLALTFGENFGHVILEAMTAGCLPIVSDRTPWRGLTEAGVGWDFPLESDRLLAALQECIDFDGSEFAARSEKVRRYAEAFHRDDTPRQQNLALFREAHEAVQNPAGGSTTIVPAALTRVR